MAEENKWNSEISDQEFEAGRIFNLANRPNQPAARGVGDLSAEALKLRFDKSAILLKNKLNELIRVVGGDQFAKEIKISLGGEIDEVLGENKINNILDLVNAIIDGTFARSILMLRGEDGEILSLQSAIEKIYLALDTMIASTLETNYEDKAPSVKAVNEGLANYFYEEKGINLFDKTAPRESGFFTGDGQVVTTTAYDHATIPVEVGKTYTYPVYVSYTGEGSAVRVACFDKDGVYIGFIEGTLSEDKQYLTVTITKARNPTSGATIDTEIAFVKVSVAIQTSNTYHVDNFMVVEGDTYPDTYESYQENTVYLREDIRVKSADSILNGRSVVFTGDSICAATTDESGVRGWAERIGVANKMAWANKGINGATITAGLDKPCIADTDFGESPDYIIMEGGTNDADLIGTYENFTPDKYGSFNMYDYTGEFDKTTFCGAVEHLFKRVTTDYAGAKIGFIIAHKMGSCSPTGDYTAEKSCRRFYFETIITLCKKWGIPYLNLWDGCYLCPMNPAHNTSGQNLMYVGDYQHLAKRGYDYATPIIEAWMLSL